MHVWQRGPLSPGGESTPGPPSRSRQAAESLAGSHMTLAREGNGQRPSAPGPVWGQPQASLPWLTRCRPESTAPAMGFQRGKGDQRNAVLSAHAGQRPGHPSSRSLHSHPSRPLPPTRTCAHGPPAGPPSSPSSRWCSPWADGPSLTQPRLCSIRPVPPDADTLSAAADPAHGLSCAPAPRASLCSRVRGLSKWGINAAAPPLGRCPGPRARSRSGQTESPGAGRPPPSARPRGRPPPQPPASAAPGPPAGSAPGRPGSAAAPAPGSFSGSLPPASSPGRGGATVMGPPGPLCQKGLG